jgi:hypothetical protein
VWAAWFAPEPDRQGRRSAVLEALRMGPSHGVLLWNVPDAVEWARTLVREAWPLSCAERVAAVPWLE